MPQPVRELEDYDGDAEVLLKRPRLAALIAAVASRATAIDNALARLYVWLLNSTETDLLDKYLELIWLKDRLAAINTLAQKKISIHDQVKLRDITNQIEKRLKERNKIIHGWWVVSDEHPDHLLLVRSKQYHFSHFYYLHADFRDSHEAKKEIANSASLYEIMRYEEKDETLTSR